MEVTIDAPTVTITPGPSTADGLPVVVNMGAGIDIGIVLSKRKNATTVSITNPNGYVNVNQYLVQIDLYNRRIAEIPMGGVSNHLVDWPNTEAGAIQCQTDLQAAFPV